MKKLGNTESGGILVEMNQDEAAEFKRLQQAVEGKRGIDLPQFTLAAAPMDMDFSGVFGAIAAFYLTKFRVNEMRRVVEELDGWLGKNKQPDYVESVYKTLEEDGKNESPCEPGGNDGLCKTHPTCDLVRGLLQTQSPKKQKKFKDDEFSYHAIGGEHERLEAERKIKEAKEILARTKKEEPAPTKDCADFAAEIITDELRKIW